jgi:hypothetical protein
MLSFLQVVYASTAGVPALFDSQNGVISVIELTQSYTAADVPPTMTAAVTQTVIASCENGGADGIDSDVNVGPDGEWQVVKGGFASQLRHWRNTAL